MALWPLLSLSWYSSRRCSVMIPRVNLAEFALAKIRELFQQLIVLIYILSKLLFPILGEVVSTDRHRIASTFLTW